MSETSELSNIYILQKALHQKAVLPYYRPSIPNFSCFPAFLYTFQIPPIWLIFSKCPIMTLKIWYQPIAPLNAPSIFSLSNASRLDLLYN